MVVPKDEPREEELCVMVDCPKCGGRMGWPKDEPDCDKFPCDECLMNYGTVVETLQKAYSLAHKNSRRLTALEEKWAMPPDKLTEMLDEPDTAPDEGFDKAERRYNWFEVQAFERGAVKKKLRGVRKRIINEADFNLDHDATYENIEAILDTAIEERGEK